MVFLVIFRNSYKSNLIPNSMKMKTRYILGALTLVLSACGGGGNSSNSSLVTPPQATFPFFQAYKAMIVNGLNATFTLTQNGTGQTGAPQCSGSGTYVALPAKAGAVFNVTPLNTVAALSSSETYTFNWTNGTCANEVSSNTTYFAASDSAPLGSIPAPGIFNLVTTATIPQTVHIGDSGPFLNASGFTDSTQQHSFGTAVETYAVTAGPTPTTALFTITQKSFSPDNTTITDVLVYSLSMDGTLKPVSFTWGGTAASMTMNFN